MWFFKSREQKEIEYCDKLAKAERELINTKTVLIKDGVIYDTSKSTYLLCLRTEWDWGEKHPSICFLYKTDKGNYFLCSRTCYSTFIELRPISQLQATNFIVDYYRNNFSDYTKLNNFLAETYGFKLEEA